MWPNILGIILSFVFVFVVLGISMFLSKKKILKEEGTRKFVHISVSNWWFFVLFMFDNICFAIVPPIIFIILNYVSYRKNIFKSMERSDANSLGTVYFPIALLISVITSFTFSNPFIGGIAIFILGFGDGFAAVIGKQFKSKKIFKDKSLLGSFTMLVISFIITFIITLFGLKQPLIVALIAALVISVVATAIELFTLKGLDNLTVPIVVIGLMHLILYIAR